MPRSQKIESRLPRMDLALQNIRLEDSVVWQVSKVEDYLYLARALVRTAMESGENRICFLSAEHESVLMEQEGLPIVSPDPDLGFDSFTVFVCKQLSGDVNQKGIFLNG